MKMVCIDTEISGPEPTDQIIELGWVTSNIKGAELYRLPHSLEMHPNNRKLTGISKEMLEKHKEFSELPDVIKDRIWVSYNVQHDINWINHTLLTYDHEPLEGIVSICLAEVVRDALGLKFFIKMEEALGRLGIGGRVKHRALPDALQHVEIFNVMIKKHPELVRMSIKKREPYSVTS